MKKFWKTALILFTFSAMIASIEGVTLAQTYQQVTTITGSSGQTTDYFKISSGEWRVRWSYTPSSDYPTYAIFSVFIYPKNETTLFVESIIKSGADGTNGTTYIHQGNQEYYMKINSANINSYTIIVESQQAEPSPSPTIPELPVAATTVVLVLTATLSFLILKKHKK